MSSSILAAHALLLARDPALLTPFGVRVFRDAPDSEANSLRVHFGRNCALRCGALPPEFHPVATLAPALLCTRCASSTLRFSLTHPPNNTTLSAWGSQAAQQALTQAAGLYRRLDALTARYARPHPPHVHRDLQQRARTLQSDLRWLHQRLGMLSLPVELADSLRRELSALITQLRATSPPPSKSVIEKLALEAYQTMGIKDVSAPLERDEVFIAFTTPAVYPERLVELFGVSSWNYAVTVLRAPRFVTSLLRARDEDMFSPQVWPCGDYSAAEAELAVGLFDPSSGSFSSFALALAAARDSLAALP